MDPHEAQLYVGQTFNGRQGAYVVGSMIGSGGFGGVFEATDTASGREVAVKILAFNGRPAHADVEFADEIELLRLLAPCSNVVTLIDEGVHDVQLSTGGLVFPVHVPFMILDRARVGLEDLLAQRRQLAWLDKMRLYRDLVKGCHQLHLRRLVHRDLKAANGLVYDEQPHGRVTDLGRGKNTREAPRFPVNRYQFGRGDLRFAPPELLRCHVLPRVGRRRIASITEDDVARLIAEMRTAGYAGWTVRGVLTPFGRVLGHAARRGMIASNPMRRLERGERPSVGRTEVRVLDSGEIAKVLAKAPALYRPLLATAIFTGLRQGELLGLTWVDVDFEPGRLRVRKQLGRDGVRVEPKTPQAIRDVELMPALGKMLREHKLRSSYSRPEDFVFASAMGSALHYRNVSRRGLDKAVEAAELAEPHPRWHDLRHTAASLLISEGLNVVYVSRQLGHASPDITLRVYAHLFDRAEHAQRARDALEAGFGHMLAGEER